VTSRTALSVRRLRGAIGPACAAVGLFLAISCGPPPAPPAMPLEPDDFTLRGVPVDADSAELRLTFGDPDSTVESRNPFNDSTPLVTWLYDGFEIRFGGGAAPIGYMIVAPGESTARGVAVGDPAERLRQLYGDPTTRSEPSWTYAYAGDSALHVIDAVIQGDTVRRIYIGWALQ
jgi:hypothetical protein